MKFSIRVVAAVVDEDVVLESEVQRRLASIYAQNKAVRHPASAPGDPVVQQVLERLISERLQLNMGYDAGVRITDAELNDAHGANRQQQSS